ncbi:hypothetical protein GCM10010980_21940 [Corynebacterium marinum]|nr:hypothetical protein GCM10010980_21940 [Corynebacterium marinum]
MPASTAIREMTTRRRSSWRCSTSDISPVDDFLLFLRLGRRRVTSPDWDIVDVTPPYWFGWFGCC